MSGIVGRKLQLGVDLDAGEVAHGVPILGAVQPAHGHATGIGHRRIELKHIALHPFRELFRQLRREPRLVRRRHNARADVAQCPHPKPVVLEVRSARKLVECDATFVDAAAVAAVAILVQDRLDLLREEIQRRVCGTAIRQPDEKGETKHRGEERAAVRKQRGKRGK